MSIHSKPSFMDKYEFRACAPITVKPHLVERDLDLRSGSYVPVRGYRNWGFRTEADLFKFLAAHPTAKIGWYTKED